jgi:hypothetical protein
VGAVDFIFGFGQSIYEDGTVRSIVPPGWVTGHARQQSTSPGRLVFKGCSLAGAKWSYRGPATTYCTCK